MIVSRPCGLWNVTGEITHSVAKSVAQNAPLIKCVLSEKGSLKLGLIIGVFLLKGCFNQLIEVQIKIEKVKL